MRRSRQKGGARRDYCSRVTFLFIDDMHTGFFDTMVCRRSNADDSPTTRGLTERGERDLSGQLVHHEARCKVRQQKQSPLRTYSRS